MQIFDYRADALHTFQIGTLNKFKFTPRVTLVNNSHTKSQYTTDYIINVSVRSNDGDFYMIKDVAELNSQEKKVIDCTQFIKNKNTEYVITFHMIPKKYKGQEFISTEREELWFLLTAQDHYVEYYNEKGFSSGVLYQSGAFNYKKFSQEETTMIQAPKCYFSKNITTYMNIVYNAFGEEKREPVKVKCALYNESKEIAKWTETIFPFTSHLLNLIPHIPKEFLQQPDNAPSFFCFYGLCEKAALLPLTVSHQSNTDGLAIEHSLPPMFYGSTMTGPNRKIAISNLMTSNLFAGL